MVPCAVSLVSSARLNAVEPAYVVVFQVLQQLDLPERAPRRARIPKRVAHFPDRKFLPTVGENCGTAA
jgi:hypothetical protein